MALATEKLYYRRGGATYAINTYTALSDVGSEALKVRVNGADRFIALGAVGDGRASYMRVQKGGATKAVLNSAITYVGVWTQCASSGTSISGYKYTTVYFDGAKLFSEASPYNFKYEGSFLSYRNYVIDGVEYVGLEEGVYWAGYHTLTTGNHSIGLRAGRMTYPRVTYYYAYAYKTV